MLDIQVTTKLQVIQSGTPGEAGGLMSVTAPRADVLARGFSISL
jgi:hypothetical protein